MNYLPNASTLLSNGTKTLAAIALAASSSLASAATIIDFDGLDASPGQTVPLLLVSEDGYIFDVSFTATGSSTGPAIFNTLCAGAACNGDSDLVPAVQGDNGIAGNVLILQESGSNIPDDDANGGTITLILVSGTPFEWLGFSAIDDGVFTGSTSEDVGALGSVNLTGESETGTAVFISSLIGSGQSITLAYSGSGGIDSLILRPVPLPTAAWLFGSALLGLVAVARRKRA